MAWRPIIIVGGGVAGLTLGIGLRRRRIPVSVWEAGDYPRHRVCGEFISGRGQRVLAQWGLREQLEAAGARPGATVEFFDECGPLLCQRLVEPAWCLSRYRLDAVLAREFERLGGRLRLRERWRGDWSEPGVVRATGRRAVGRVNGWRYFGLKFHVRAISLSSDLEVHFHRAGYVGLCRLSEGVNVCGLFRGQGPLPDLARDWIEFTGGKAGSCLRQRLAGAALDPASPCAVGGLSFAGAAAEPGPGVEIGDALGMLAPLAGNGMSMALESAALALEPLASYSAGGLEWDQARLITAAKCTNAFKRRWRWARGLQAALFQPACRSVMARVVRNWPAVWFWLLARVR